MLRYSLLDLLHCTALHLCVVCDVSSLMLPCSNLCNDPPFSSCLSICVCSVCSRRALLALSDELIRQMTINCAERGLLLLRVRDEIRMTIASYQTLYESSIAFGMRKALSAEQTKADMEAKVRLVVR